MDVSLSDNVKNGATDDSDHHHLVGCLQGHASHQPSNNMDVSMSENGATDDSDHHHLVGCLQGLDHPSNNMDVSMSSNVKNGATDDSNRHHLVGRLEELVSNQPSNNMDVSMSENDATDDSDHHHLVGRLEELVSNQPSNNVVVSMSENGATDDSDHHHQGHLQGHASHQSKKETKNMSTQTLISGYESPFEIIQQIKKECLKPDSEFDDEKVDALMELTYKSRYSMIIEEFARVRPVLELYPALMNKRQLVREFSRVIAVNEIQNLFEMNINKFSDVINHMAPDFGQKFEDMTDGCEDSMCLRCSAALLLLPDYTEEKLESIVEFEAKEPTVDTPVILCPVSRENVLKGQPEFEIYAEKSLITKTQDFMEAVLLLFSIFYTFNMSYPPAFMVTASVMEVLFLEITPQPGDEADKVNAICKHLQDSLDEYMEFAGFVPNSEAST